MEGSKHIPLVPNLRLGHVFSSSITYHWCHIPAYADDAIPSQYRLVYGISKEPRGFEVTRITSSTMLFKLGNDQGGLQRSPRFFPHCLQSSPLRSVDSHLSSFADTLQLTRYSGSRKSINLPHTCRSRGDVTRLGYAVDSTVV